MMKQILSTCVLAALVLICLCGFAAPEQQTTLNQLRAIFIQAQSQAVLYGNCSEVTTLQDVTGEHTSQRDTIYTISDSGSYTFVEEKQEMGISSGTMLLDPDEQIGYILKDGVWYRLDEPSIGVAPIVALHRVEENMPYIQSVRRFDDRYEVQYDSSQPLAFWNRDFSSYHILSANATFWVDEKYHLTKIEQTFRIQPEEGEAVELYFTLDLRSAGMSQSQVHSALQQKISETAPAVVPSVRYVGPIS